MWEVCCMLIVQRLPIESVSEQKFLDTSQLRTIYMSWQLTFMHIYLLSNYFDIWCNLLKPVHFILSIFSPSE